MISAATAAALRQMLEGVLAPGGTASEVSIPGYQLAGKTGTASKVDPATGQYSQSAYVASFIGFAPASDPKLLCAVIVDEPQSGSIYGGTVAAPAFGQIMSLRAALPGHPARIASAHEARRVDRHRSALARRAPVRWRSPGSPTTAARSARALCSSACAAFAHDGHEFAAQAVRQRRGGARRRASARPRRARGGGRVGPRRDGPARGALLRRSERRAAGRGGDRDERQDDHGLPGARAAGGDRRAVRAAGDGQVGRRRARAAGDPHDARGDRPAGRLPRDARRRRSRLRDGGLLARAGARTHRRDPLRRGGVHEPDAGPPRLPRRRWRTTSRPSAGCSQLAAAAALAPAAQDAPRGLRA